MTKYVYSFGDGKAEGDAKVITNTNTDSTVDPDNEVRRKGGSPEEEVRSKQFEILLVSILEYGENQLFF